MDFLLLIAFLCDLFTPILIVRFGLPGEFRYAGHIFTFLFILIGFISLKHGEGFPKAIWLILAISVFGIAIALINGQSVFATIWGWWLMLKFPLVGLSIYFQEINWLKKFAKRAAFWCILLVLVEVIVQIWQYRGGVTPGDHLSGTIVPNGTAALVLILEWVLALTLGEMIARRKLWPLGMAIGLGIISSILGQMRLFFYATAFMGLVALLILFWRAGRPLLAVPLVLGLGIVIYAFPILYSSFAPDVNESSFFDILNPRESSRYFNGIIGYSSTYGYDVGRNYMLQYIWRQSAGDLSSRLAGFGLGARGESKLLGSVGISLLRGELGINTGSSLAVILGELGLLGILILTVFLAWVIIKLWKASAVEPDQSMAVIQYGLLIYTLFMPIWLWYATTWVLPVPMLLYWMTLGYQIRRLRQQAASRELPQPVSKE